MTRWQLEGNAAEVYERDLVPAVFAPFADRLLELAPPRRGDRVLDVACGTGIVTRKAVPHGAQAVGVDLNGPMIEVARAIEPSIEWIVADACELPLPDDSFDLVLCQAGLQFFSDKATAVAEMRRVLAPQGRLAVVVWRAAEHQPAWLKLAAALDRHAGPETGALMRAPFAFSDPAELRELVGGDVRIVIETVRFPSAREMLASQAAASPLAGPIQALSDEAREALAADFESSMRPYTDDAGVAFPQEAHVVTTTR
jgi:SAM-dependent methyltransferase